MRGRPRGVLAAVLSLVVLGLGDVYNGETRRGLSLFALGLAINLGALIIWSVLLTVAPSFGTLVALVPVLLLGVGLYLYGCRRAYVHARRLTDVPRGRVRACVAYALGLGLLTWVLRDAVRSTSMQAFKMPSGSMLDTLEIGDHFLVNRFLYGARLESPFTHVPLARLPAVRPPRPGDVVVFLAPPQASGDRQRRDFVKRIVAVEGQTIEVRAKQVYIGGKPWDDAHAHFVSGPPDAAAPALAGVEPCGSLRSGAGRDCAPITVPPGHVFLMGDNREQSYDSRYWGPVPVGDVKGKVLVVYWSWAPEGGVRWQRIGHAVE